MIQSSLFNNDLVTSSFAPILTVGTAFDKESLQLLACISCPESPQEVDELSAYMSETVTTADGEMIKANGGVIHYWLTKKRSFPALCQVELLILETPASSASSYPDLSVLRTAVRKHMCNLKDNIIDAKHVFHSYFSINSDCKFE